MAVPSAAGATVGAPTEGVEAAAGGVLGAVVELTKPRITRLVTMTAGVGFLLSMIGRGGDGWSWLLGGAGCLAGTALSSSGANALNQCMEHHRDARMHRTRTRPIPSGRIGVGAGAAAGGVMCLAGVGLLWLLCGPGAAAISAATIATYLLLYTPLKPVTVLNTWVGAVPGALPPLIGWCAAAWISGRPGHDAGPWAGLGEAGGWSLFALMAVWQIPHFLAIAWLHHEDYARGGYRMLPIIDAEDGRKTAWMVVVWSVLLVPATLGPWWVMTDRLGLGYAVLAGVTGAAYLAMASTLLRDRRPARARKVFLASIVHLPVLLVGLVVDGLVRAWW